LKTPYEIASDLIGIGKKKASAPAVKLLALGILAGMFIALAAAGSSTASSMIENPGVSKLVGALLFPAGLAMVLIAGSELFTGNSLIIISVLEKEASVGGLLKNWLFVYAGNFIGAVLAALLINLGNQPGLFANQLAAFTIKVAAVKSSLPFGNAFVLGILCNFLVCVAVWMSFAAKDVTGRIAGLYFPVMLFVLSGFEHSVANMYYVPAGIFALSNPVYAAAAAAAGVNTNNLTWGNFFIHNLIPVTLGNIIGGAVLVGFMYWFLYLKKEKPQGREFSAKM
jgi:formate/nitrite transporter